MNRISALVVPRSPSNFGPVVQSTTCMTDSGKGPLELFLACKQRPHDQQAWEALLRQVYPSFRGIALRICRQYGLHSQDDILDSVQEPVLKLSRSLHKVPATALQCDATISAYMRALAANTIRDFLRSRFAQKRGELETVHLDDRIPELAINLSLSCAERSTLLRQIDEMLDASARDRSVFWLYFRQGFTAKEIAQISSLQLSTEGVESLIHRLVAFLRARLAKTASESNNTKSRG